RQGRGALVADVVLRQAERHEVGQSGAGEKCGDASLTILASRSVVARVGQFPVGGPIWINLECFPPGSPLPRFLQRRHQSFELLEAGPDVDQSALEPTTAPDQQRAQPIPLMPLEQFTLATFKRVAPPVLLAQGGERALKAQELTARVASFF